MGKKESVCVECFGIFCTKSQSAQIYIVRINVRVLLFLCYLSVYSFVLSAIHFIRFYFGEITCKTHFIRSEYTYFFHFTQHKRYRARAHTHALLRHAANCMLFCFAIKHKHSILRNLIYCVIWVKWNVERYEYLLARCIRSRCTVVVERAMCILYWVSVYLSSCQVSPCTFSSETEKRKKREQKTKKLLN